MLAIFTKVKVLAAMAVTAGGLAIGTQSANAAHLRIGVRLPLPVFVAPRPAVVYVPAPVVVMPAPVVVAPAPVIAAPACVADPAVAAPAVVYTVPVIQAPMVVYGRAHYPVYGFHGLHRHRR